MDRASEVAQVETFRPRLAPMMAVAWYLLAAFGAYDLVSRGDGREVPIGLVCLALITVVVYAIAQRPAVIAGPSGVLLRNVVRDVWLPVARRQEHRGQVVPVDGHRRTARSAAGP